MNDAQFRGARLKPRPTRCGASRSGRGFSHAPDADRGDSR